MSDSPDQSNSDVRIFEKRASIRLFRHILPGLLVAMVAVGGLTFGAIQLHGMATGFLEARTWWEAAIRWAGPMLGGLVVGWGAVWLLSGGLGSPHIRLESDAIELSGGQRIPYSAIRRVGSAEHQSGTGRDRYTWSAMLIEWETDQDSLERTNISPALYTIQDTDNALADALAERVGCERERIERRLLGLYYDFPS